MNSILETTHDEVREFRYRASTLEWIIWITVVMLSWTIPIAYLLYIIGLNEPYVFGEAPGRDADIIVIGLLFTMIFSALFATTLAIPRLLTRRAQFDTNKLICNIRIGPIYRANESLKDVTNVVIVHTTTGALVCLVTTQGLWIVLARFTSFVWSSRESLLSADRLANDLCDLISVPTKTTTLSSVGLRLFPMT